MELHEIRQTAVAIAHEAGKVLMRYYNQPMETSAKDNNAFDIVTDADHDSEQHIVAALHRAFPDHHIIGEEGANAGTNGDVGTYVWYVDPLDGTVNFSNGIPVFAVSLALCDRQMRPLVGVVYNPAERMTFSAVKDGGALLEDIPLSVSRTSLLGEAVVCSGFPYDKASNPDNNLREWGEMLVRVRGIRRFGSAALDLCYVAMGRFDGYWENRLKPWDGLAGMLVVSEAGGMVSDYSGAQSLRLYSGLEVLATNGRIHNQMLAVIQEARRKPLPV